MKDSDDRKQDEASSLSMDQSSSPQKPNDKMLATCATPWQLRELRLLYELTQFENLSPCYAATVPACWTELMQAQKQRRHPQHLQHADEVHHTRSWRLQHDNSTWDEHVLEMTLPQSACIGHVDVKFTLHSHCATPPQIEVTLLKQNATAIGRHSRSAATASPPAPDATVDFNLNTDSKKGLQENPVTNEEYLETHNMEVLAGPINLASCLDLTEQGGTITFSSVKLFRVRSRTLLVHMKSLADPAAGQASGKKAKVDPNFSWDMSNMANSTPDSIVERLTNASRKVEYVGCDWIHEVSITIRKAKQTEIPNERLERYAMLESNTFVEKLLDVIFASSSSDNGDRGRVEQSIALDILNWIAVIRLGRLRCCEPSWHRLQLEFVKLIQAYQHVLIQTCFVQGGRSTAQKCVKLFTICSDGVKNLEDNSLKDFNRSLVEVFLESLNSILQSWSAGAMRWFFHCLARMIAADPNSALKASYRSLMLLSKVARHLKIRQNPSYLLLRSRFGLYGTPLEAELFDIEPPVPAKFSSMPVTYASLVAQELAWAGGVGVGGSLGGASSSSAAANEPIDLRELLPIFGNGNNQSESGKPNLYHNLAKLKGLTSNLYMKGLLEVEPLHFTCHSTSDGTKLEKMESVGMSNPWGNLYEAQPFHLAASETNKAINELDGPLSWQQLLTAPAQQMLVIERMHSGARRFVVLDLGCVVLLTDLIVPSCPELLSLSVDIWTRSEEVDAQRLVVASDIASKTLVMSDIQPPPVCRYIKITTIGRYGMSTTKCKIPIGSFFGHMVLLPGEDYAEKTSLVQNMTEENTQNQIQVLSALFEDVQCRYSLACSKLENLVTPLLSSESPNVGHMYNYLHKVKETTNNLETQKITTAYQECITYQHQLNIIRSVMRRFGAKSTPVSTDIQQNLTTSCTDKLRVLGESLTDLLLYIVYGVGFDPRVDSAHLHQMVDESQCERLFNCICVGEDIRMQVSCCTLLVRLCGLQPWWGSFLVNTIKHLYSSKQFNIFPQDRVFILLIYMGRKSLCGGANRSSVMDSLLKTILNQLQSLATSADDQEEGAVGGGEEAGAVGGGTGFFRLQMDLSLVGWLLLFLSQCLDSQPSFCSLDELPDKMKNSKNSAPASRWDFLQGEMAMQRRTYLTNKCTASRNYRRKLQKKLMHHKQQLDDLESAKKAFHASTQALSALSSQAAKLSCKLETALKQQEQYYKKSAKQATSPRTSKDQQGSFRSSRSGESCSDSDGKRGSNSLKDSDCQFLMLPRTHCLPVARALIKFLLHMDITCNIDLFLLVCKVIARVTVWTKPGVSLGEIMTQDQLASLLLIAVSNRSVWGGPWASHAITCLLQDIIQGVNSKPSSPVDQADSRAESKESDDPMRMPMREPSILDVNIMPGPSSSSSAKNGESYVLPSLFESDDSDMEDLLEDILERGKTLFIRKSSSRMAVGAVSSISTALDSRLEYGLENNVSVNLRRITAQAAYNLPLCINSSIAQKGLQNDGSSLPVWDESITAPWQLPANSSVGLSSIEMLSTAFDTLFGQLNQSRDGDLEAVVQLWLTLSTENDSGGGGRNFDASVVPLIQLSPSAISSLMSTLANRGGISVREWCLSFQALTLFSNLQCTSPPTSPTPSSDQLEHALCGAASLVVNDANFVPMLDAFLSSPHIKGCAGVSVCNSLHELLVRLEMRCDVVSGNSTWGNRLKELLLNLVYMLVSEGGAIAALYGPLDAQTGLILLLLHLNFPNINLSTAVGILQSVGVLIERYVLNAEGTGGGGGASGRGGRGGGGASEAPSHSGSQSQQQQPMGGSSLTFVLNNPSWEHLLIVIIRLVTNLVQTPLEAPPGEDTQTDEHKAAHSSQAPVKAKCVADFVVQQERTMAQLIGGLGGCQWSSFSMLRSGGGSGGYSPDSSDPVSIGDALLQLLSTLANKATDPKLILKPLFTHLSTCGLTIPLQWLVLQVLDSDQALRELLEMSGMDIISANLVETTGMLISSQPSTVSVIMQYLSQMPNCAPLTASSHHKKGCSSSSGGGGGGNYANNSTAVATVNNNNNNGGGGNSSGSNGGAHVTSSSSSSHLESHDSMVNFAPLGSIICSSNPTSQSADVLIQPAPPHRRARTPAWSYHFYSEESWVDLTITLPCAVLLKAVHIQPHLSSLATCPSGVSVEISRDGGRSGFVPVAAPFNTSGLTHVRLTLPHAEVVTSVLLRLYKPRDSSNIGLSQIKLLGATTFGDSDLPDARRPSRYTQSSLGWLRLLHHCLTACSDPALRRSLLDAASGSPAASASPAASSRLLSACCSLLLASSGPAAVTESVLLTLGLHSSQLGLQLIGVLLNNGGSLASAVQSVVGLLFRLGTTVDDNIRERLAAMLDWLHQAATTVQNQLSTAYIQCLSSILWTCYEKNLYCDLPSMITQPLFSAVYEWTLKLSPHSCLKKAIDSVLCSMCYINPALFPTLLQRMNILVPISTSSPQASISDDRKDTEQSASSSSSSSSSLTDDSKEQWWGGRVVLQDHTNMALSEGQLLTVAVACQSPPATRHLLDSGLPSLIAHALLGFCLKKKNSETKNEPANQSRMTDSDKASGRNHVISVDAMGVMLKFLEEVCMAGQMRDWLGSPEGSIFWGPLLSLLCNKPTNEKSLQFCRCDVSSTLHSLESATVSFLARCCWCHPNNQKLLAKVLSDVISQHKTTNHKTGGISGVTRRMILQLLLESEKVFVSVEGWSGQNNGVITPTHPRHVSRLVHLSVHTTIADILRMISGAASVSDGGSGSGGGSGGSGEGVWEVRGGGGGHESWQEVDMSVAAGVTAKDKRLKDAKNAQQRATPYGKKARTNQPDTQASQNMRLCLRHPDLEEKVLPGSLTLSQLLYILDERGISLSNPYIFLTLDIAKSSSTSSDAEQTDLTQSPSLPTALQVFTQQGGLALLAEHLPPVYPETLARLPPPPPPPASTAPDSASAPAASASAVVDQVVYDAWVKVEPNDDIYEDLDEYVCLGEGQSSSTVGSGGAGGKSGGGRGGECGGGTPTVPLHSLAAFGLFLRLPGYAEVLLRDKCKAQCLLRLTLGVTDDGEGGDILTCPVAGSLPTLPFEVLRLLLESTPLTTDDGRLLRRTALDTGALRLLLACLAIFTHQPPSSSPNTNQTAGTKQQPTSDKGRGTGKAGAEEKSHLYWR
ncbi:baculoviral IAP repeat-containing protein 6 isoform X3 [Nilaparvata lugens]|uniref:baculoviral IAP repeat-containing protein 6 isoform X3 n=1 Tax=Nilaparvata lugens TaxID=108931 RepID=UPI00193E5882|nr:baculoviral IAP repeat-containing protein 6 isoform X3 [Nilaparvata lugens]